MTEDQRKACLAISPDQVTYLPGSWNKRFARDMASRGNAEDWERKELTGEQWKFVCKTAIRFRKQIHNNNLVQWCRVELGRLAKETLDELRQLEAAERKRKAAP